MVYLPTINDWLEQSQYRPRKASKNAFHPSGISHPCKRNIYYQFFKIPRKPFTSKTLRILDAGNDMHDRYDRYAEKAGILLVSNMKIKDRKLQLSGKPDQIVLIDGKLRLIELKSMKKDKFDGLFGNPFPHHYEQLQMYFWMLNNLWKTGSKRKLFKQYGHLFPLTEGSIIIECKDDQRQEEFNIPYDEVTALKLIEKAKEVAQLVKENKLPSRDFNQTSQECRYCDYNDVCWGVSALKALSTLGEKDE